MEEKNKIRNTIITISGEPVSGKGTTVKMLVQKLKEQGYADKQIHLESTGKEFRRYFNSIVDLIVNMNDEKKSKEISEREELKEIFESKEYRDIFKKSIADLMNKNMDLSHFTIEQANDAPEFKDVRSIVDTLIDKRMEQKGKIINEEEHPNEVWIIDSRLASFNIPEAFSVRLTANSRVAGERLFNDQSRGNEDHYNNLEDAIKEREKRRIGEKKRFIDIYDYDLEDENNYNLIIDTSYSSVDDIADCILDCEKYFDKEEYFEKKWASPKIFLPMQDEMKTLGRAPMGFSFEEMLESIEKNGYLPNSPIEILDVDNVKYILEGHHRNFAAAQLGKTLVPYKTVAKDDENIPNSGNTARTMAHTDFKCLYGHEEFIERGIPETFSYSFIYPKFIEKLREEERY